MLALCCLCVVTAAGATTERGWTMFVHVGGLPGEPKATKRGGCRQSGHSQPVHAALGLRT